MPDHVEGLEAEALREVQAKSGSPAASVSACHTVLWAASGTRASGALRSTSVKPAAAKAGPIGSFSASA
ncbi:MAG: hypothetical protein U1E65_13120 [Myxococcota bacterium]